MKVHLLVSENCLIVATCQRRNSIGEFGKPSHQLRRAIAHCLLEFGRARSVCWTSPAAIFCGRFLLLAAVVSVIARRLGGCRERFLRGPEVTHRRGISFFVFRLARFSVLRIHNAAASWHVVSTDRKRLVSIDVGARLFICKMKYFVFFSGKK